MRLSLILLLLSPVSLLTAATTRPTTYPSTRAPDGTIIEMRGLHRGAALEIPEDKEAQERLKRDLQWAGTEIALQITRPQLDLAGIDVARCQLLIAHDDKGTDLTRRKIPWLPAKWPTTSGFDFEHDPAKATIDLQFADSIADDATKIDLDGKIAFFRGMGRGVVKVEKIPIDQDSKEVKLQLAGRKLVALVHDFPGQVELELATGWQGTDKSPPGDLALIREVKLFDEAGKPIPSRIGGGGSTTQDNMQYVSRINWRMERRPEQVSAVITHYQRLEGVEVPFHLEYTIRKPPQGPFNASFRLEKFNSILDLAYNKYLLINSDVSPMEINAQVKKHIDSLNEIEVSEIPNIPIKTSEREIPLHFYINSWELKIHKSPPQTQPAGK